MKNYNVESFEAPSHKELQEKINSYLNRMNAINAINVSLSIVLDENKNLIYYAMLLYEYN